MSRYQVVPKASQIHPALAAKLAGQAATPPPPPAPVIPDLVIGQRFHARDQAGIITRIHGKQNPGSIGQMGGGVVVYGGSAEFDAVFTGENPHFCRHLAEAIVRGWKILPGIATAEEIATAIQAADTHQAAIKLKEEQSSAQRAAARAALPGQHPWLKTVKQSGKSSYACGAANLKIELARAFPGVAFSVKSESYSMGNSIRVGWDAGPCTKDVDAIADKYAQGSFDGMTDMYNYDGANVWPDVFGGAKYVTTRRNFPDALYEAVGRQLCDLQQIPWTSDRTPLFGPGSRDVLHCTSRLFEQTPFPPNYQIKAIESSDEHVEVPFRIVFEGTTAAPAVCEPASGELGITLTESVHTKHGHKIWVVQLAARVERDDYLKLRSLAQKLGGYYSSYRGNGAIPGFTFKVQGKAVEFQNSIPVTLGRTAASAVTESAPGEQLKTPEPEPETPDPILSQPEVAEPEPEDFWTMAGEPSPLPDSWCHPVVRDYAANVFCVCVTNNATNSSVLVGKYRERETARLQRDALLTSIPPLEPAPAAPVPVRPASSIPFWRRRVVSAA